MAARSESADPHELKSTSYELFILLLSLISIFNLVVQAVGRALGHAAAMLDVILIIDALLTVFFLFDFFFRLVTARTRSEYFVGRQGWADLLACLPMLRIFRLFRIVRASRLLRHFGLRPLVDEVVNNRADSALYITIVAIIVIMELAGTNVLRAESGSPDGNIKTAGDAVWYTLVTMTTVGYGDRFPTTPAGRVIGAFVMMTGIGLIGVFTSFMANFFLAPAKKERTEPTSPDDPMRRLAELRRLLEEQEKAAAAVREKLAEYERELAARAAQQQSP